MKLSRSYLSLGCLFISLLALGLAHGASAACCPSVIDDFDPNANGAIQVVVLQPDGKVLIGGSFTSVAPNGGATVARNRIARLNPDGTVDTTFDPGANNTVLAIVVQTDGKILVGGSFTTLGGGGAGTTARNRIGRLKADGSLDTAFDPGANSIVNVLALQGDGKILVGGGFTALGGGGTGTTTRDRIGRLNSDGSLDSTFDPGANSSVFALAVQADGKILVGGIFGTLGGGGTGTTPRSHIGRLNSNGTLDATFDPGANGDVVSIALQGDGKILAAGRFTALGGGGTGGTARNRIARINPDGSLDFSFNPGADGDVLVLALQLNGKILVGGLFTHLGGGTGNTVRNRIGLLKTDGSLDTAFDPNANTSVVTLAVQGNGKILVGGNFTALAPNGGPNVTRNRIARLDYAGEYDLQFSGYTNGCFGQGCAPPDTNATQTASLLGLQYVNSQFSGPTIDGNNVIAGSPSPPPTQNVNNLGAFLLSNSPADYNGLKFTLRVSLALPPNINPGGSTLVSATLAGQVSSAGDGTVQIDFDNSLQHFTFSYINSDGLTTDGSFTFRVNDPPAISPGQVVELDGQILDATQTRPGPGALQFSPNAFSVDEDAGNATITVARTGGSNGVVSVHYATSDGTATAGSDYTATSGTLTFASGETSKSFTIPILDDRLDEPDERLNLSLSDPQGGAVVGPYFITGFLTIRDDEVPGTLQFSSSAYSINEGGGSATITVTRTGGSDGAVSVQYFASSGTATAGGDFTAVSGTLSFADGETNKSFTVPILEDALDEQDEKINLLLTNAQGGAALGTPTISVLTIVDNDTPPSLAVNDATVTEGATGTTTATFTVTLSAVSGQAVTVNYLTASGTATAGSDFFQTSGTLTFNPGETSKTVPVFVIGDTAFEPDETFPINLSNAVNATLSRAQGLGTILNDDVTDPGAGTLQFLVDVFTASENNSTATVTVTRTGGNTGDVSVQYATSDGTAIAGHDYLADSGTLTFASGETSKTFTVTILDDGAPEESETANLTLSNPQGGATLGARSTALLSIADNDALPTPTPGVVGNVSTRLPVGTGDDVLIEGFIVQGPAGSTKKIVVRAIGPSLAPFGIPDALVNPTLEIHDASANNATVATNDDWRSTQVGGLITGDQSAEIASSGVPPSNDLESAIIADLAPGSYTAVVRGVGNTTGTGVVDAYDLSAASPARLANIATRGLVQPGDKLMIAGFIVQNGPVKAVVRAIGPSLSAFGISNALPDTTVQLRDSNGAVVRENDDWQTDQQQDLINTGLQPSDDLEAALVETLQPGQYTAQVRGNPEQTGIGVVQVYFLQ
jgi:uncharacterized delta-60 repeat protein